LNETCAGRWAGRAFGLLTGLLTVLLTVGLTGCGWTPPGRVLVIGIDGATMRLAGRLLEQGRLPNLARIAEAGASGELKSFRPLFSPRIWTTIATGKTPAKHGIAGFTFRDDDDEQHLYLSVHRESAALWNIVSDAGGMVGVVNWWNTYPPEVVRGVLVSDHAKPQRVAELSKLTGVDAEEDGGSPVFPPQWRARVAAAYDATDALTDFVNPFDGDHGLARWMRAAVLAKRFYEDEAAVRVALEIEREIQPDLMMVFLPGIDRVSHHLWGTLVPEELYPTALRPTPSQREAGANALRGYYAYTDALIGRLLEPYGPDDLVMVVSDHGFEPGLHLGTLTGIHDSTMAEDGVLFMRGPGVPAGTDTKGVTVNDITPTVLAWLGLPLGEDMDGTVVPFLEYEPIEPIPTHDVRAIEYLDTVPSGSEDEILEQLRDLGYIE
jgi:predicted AlkP superfamily phosphohydrolase/phosphomutase